ncbi:hypothetical protein ScPMuIL_017701 [Solemya velum]
MNQAHKRFDDKAALKLLQSGLSSNFVTGNDTSLLHKCCIEDNISGAELLISQGADVNVQDDDLWTPLHLACSKDNVEMVHLLLDNGADATKIDVDGFFPIDQATEGSESYQILNKHTSGLGLDTERMKQIQAKTPKQMLEDVQKLITSGADLNIPNEEGVTLLHIASANGYMKVLRTLLKGNANISVTSDNGWMPIHVAAYFNQTKAVKKLLRYRADPTVVTREGSKPSLLTTSDELRAILMKAERGRYDPTEEPEEEKDENKFARVNSKTIKQKHSSLSKKDEMFEASTRLSWTESSDPNRSSESMENEDEDMQCFEEEQEEQMVSKIWKGFDSEQASLPPVSSTDNFANLSEITERILLEELQKRYSTSQIYTYIGDILIAVNPCQSLPIYAKSISNQYHSCTAWEDLPPHIYAMAERAYKALIGDSCSQCCIISGESGAGKTESCKLFIQQLLRVASSDENNLNNKINQVNPLLEAFGNAVTVMNDNSSRFAKYVELFFSPEGKVLGAQLTEYLLEKSRLVIQGKGEMSFHIFYWMFSGFSPEEFELYGLRKITDHRYLRPLDIQLSTMINQENREKFWEVKECLKYIGFTQKDIQNLFTMLSAALHLGDVTFHPVGRNDAAQIHNMDTLKKVAAMLEVSGVELASALVAEYTMTRGEQIKKEFSVHQANDCRDALAKTIYGRLFSWIVNGINQMVHPAVEGDMTFQQIGIFDIFGFENFARNSFEQLCINLANEQIQLFTNEHMFFMEQKDCMLEGVPLVDLNFKSNQSTIDLFLQRHTGVLAILDEESRFPKATDSTLATKLHQTPGKMYPEIYKTPRDGGATFTIIHYAGSVTYDLRGILDKNRDTLPTAILYTMKTSNSLLVKELFQSKVTRIGSLAPSARQQRKRTTTKSPFEFFKKMKGAKPDSKKQVIVPPYASERKGPSTMAYHFKNSLADLVTKMQAAKPHFIRCIKPNNKKAPLQFYPELVLAQLRYTGVTEAVKIRKFGYALRIKFHDFLLRYEVLSRCIVPSYAMTPDDNNVKQYCSSVKLKTIRWGR